MASILDVEVGVSGRSVGSYRPSPMGRKKASFRSIKSSCPSPTLWFADQEEDRHYFLESCSLCGKRLGGNSDIFMYRGDMAFCSEECREEQMEIDETNERNMRKVSMKTKASAQNVVAAAQGVHARTTGTVVVG